MRPSSGRSGADGAGPGPSDATTLPVGGVVLATVEDECDASENGASLPKGFASLPKVFDGEDVLGSFAPTTDGAMSKQKYVCTPTAEMKSDKYGARRIASLAAIDEEEEGISGVWSVGKW